MTETNTARAFWIQRPGVGEVVGSRLPPRREGDVLVRTLYSGISRGTESLVFRGEVPSSQHDAMRAPFQEGDFPGPVKYGYSSVGRVVEAPEPLAGGEESVRVGTRVFCLHPHQDLYAVPVEDVVPVPEDLPSERAVLAANMETAINAVWDGRPTVGDRVGVIGAGVVGCLVAWLCRRIAGAEVTLVDLEPTREEVARALDIPFARGLPRGADMDLVLHASGSPAGLRTALEAAGPEATIVEISWYGSRSVPLPLGEDFHSRRLTLRSSQVGQLPPERIPRWDRARRMRLALDLLRDPGVEVLLTGESEFEELPRVMERMSGPDRSILCHRIRYPGA